MTTIITKRHPLKFYALLAFATLVMCGIGTILLAASINIFKKELSEIKGYFLLLLSLFIYWVSLAMVYSYWKNSPKIILDKHTIKIGDESFYIKDIKDITLTGKMPFRFITTFPMEGTAILFKDGSQKFLFDDMYSNSSELKVFLEQVVVKKQDVSPTVMNKINKNEIGVQNEETFKGNQFISLRGISLWGVIGFFLYMILNKWSLSIGLLIFFGAFGTFWFIFNSWLMHYFGLTNDYLIVRNHNFIWKVKIYHLTNIKEVVFEAQGKQPNSMRIITNDFRNKIYPAGTLRDKTWLDLKDKLEAKGVIVRNECIF